jgi:hypothetical protein
MAIENGLGDQKLNRFGNYALNPNRTPESLELGAAFRDYTVVKYRLMKRSVSF